MATVTGAVDDSNPKQHATYLATQIVHVINVGSQPSIKLPNSPATRFCLHTLGPPCALHFRAEPRSCLKWQLFPRTALTSHLQALVVHLAAVWNPQVRQPAAGSSTQLLLPWTPVLLKPGIAPQAG